MSQTAHKVTQIVQTHADHRPLAYSPDKNSTAFANYQKLQSYVPEPRTQIDPATPDI